MKFHTYIYIAAALMSASCTREPSSDERAITLSAGISQVIAETKAAQKADAYTGDVPTNDNSLAVDLWFSKTSGDYSERTPPTNDINYIPCHTTHEFVSGAAETIFYANDDKKALKYPTTDDYVYCTGFYPQDTWEYSETEGIIAEAEISGYVDLMYAPEIQGKWNEQFGSTEASSQEFRHALTWLKIVSCATSYDAIDAWGKITGITVSSDTAVSLKTNMTLDYQTPDEITVYEETDGKELSILFDEEGIAGSVFVSPEEKVTVTVTTADGKTATKEIAPSGGFKAGNQYVIALYFNSLAIIDGVCTLTSFENVIDSLYGNVTDNQNQ